MASATSETAPMSGPTALAYAGSSRGAAGRCTAMSGSAPYLGMRYLEAPRPQRLECVRRFQCEAAHGSRDTARRTLSAFPYCSLPVTTYPGVSELVTCFDREPTRQVVWIDVGLGQDPSPGVLENPTGHTAAPHTGRGCPAAPAAPGSPRPARARPEWIPVAASRGARAAVPASPHQRNRARSLPASAGLT